MGNDQKKPEQHSHIQNRIILQLRSRQIILHHSYKMGLQVSDVGVFPHGLDGLKLWESDIIAARFAILNNNLFEKRKVFVVNCGVGTPGIAVRKWTKCEQVVMSDFHAEVVQNAKRNCDKNACKDITIFRLDWNELNQYSSQYDVIFGADVFYMGSPYKELYQLLVRFLKIGGRAIFIVPEKEDERKEFFKILQINQNRINEEFKQWRVSKRVEGQEQPEFFQFDVSKTNKLTHEQYFLSPLLNKVQGLEEFPLIANGQFAAFIITKMPMGQPIQQIPQRQKKGNGLEQIEEKPKLQANEQEEEREEIRNQKHDGEKGNQKQGEEKQSQQYDEEKGNYKHGEERVQQVPVQQQKREEVISDKIEPAIADKQEGEAKQNEQQQKQNENTQIQGENLSKPEQLQSNEVENQQQTATMKNESIENHESENNENAAENGGENATEVEHGETADVQKQKGNDANEEIPQEKQEPRQESENQQSPQVQQKANEKQSETVVDDMKQPSKDENQHGVEQVVEAKDQKLQQSSETKPVAEEREEETENTEKQQKQQSVPEPNEDSKQEANPTEPSKSSKRNKKKKR